MTAPSAGWVPLPECLSCGRPTRRRTFQRLAGRCSSCHASAHPITQRERLELAEWQRTVADLRRQEAREAAARAARRQAARQTRGRP